MNMEEPETAAKASASRHITPATTLQLWVRAGGRCSRCNTFLLEEPFFERHINLGERAHIAGWTDAAGSPRSDSEVPLSERNKADNLILLCQPCHSTIDAKDTRHEYPEELLLAMKHEQEERIHHLTAMARDRETAVLRLFSSVRGSIPEMARDVAIQTVYQQGGRYAKFPLSVTKHAIEIDLTALPDPEAVGESYWQFGKSIIDKHAQQVAVAVHGEHVRHLSVFALARMPFLIYLGFVLDDKVPMDVYQKQRGGDEGWGWTEEHSVRFETRVLRDGDPTNGLALLLNLSGTGHLEECPVETEGMPVWEIRPRDENPNPNLFRSRETLDTFTRHYQDVLAEIEATAKATPAIHLLPIVPVSAAIACGRHLMRHVHPPVVIYDRIGTTFKTALTINER